MRPQPCSQLSKGARRGATTIEMTLVGIPLIFTLISVFEISRGMWNYQTLAYAAKEGVRFASVHGANCSQNSNNCATTIAQVAGVVQKAAVGLDFADPNTTLTFYSAGAVTNGLPADPSPITCTLTACASNNTQWPSSASAAGSAIAIQIKAPFRSALAMFWPGAAKVSFSAVLLSGSSTDEVQF